MLFITGPLYSGKRTFAKPFGGRQIYEVQDPCRPMPKACPPLRTSLPNMT